MKTPHFSYVLKFIEIKCPTNTSIVHTYIGIFDNFSKGQAKNEMNQVVLFSGRQIYKFYNELVPIPFLKTPFLFPFPHSPFIPHTTIFPFSLHYIPYILDW